MNPKIILDNNNNTLRGAHSFDFRVGDDMTTGQKKKDTCAQREETESFREVVELHFGKNQSVFRRENFISSELHVRSSENVSLRFAHTTVV